MTVIKHLIISGDVQGVGFRYFMRRTAQRLGVSGWVRNRRDGAVEAMVQGTPEAVEALIESARVGPEAARVDRIDVTPGAGNFTRFEMLDIR